MIAIYLRVSSDKQDEAMQLSAIKRLLTKEEFENSKIYKDHGITGSTTERPDYQKMLIDITSGKIEKVIAYELSRLWRDMEEQSRMIKMLKSINVKLQSSTEGLIENEDDRLKAGVIGVVNEHERARLIRRTREGIFEKKKAISEGKDVWKGRGKDKKLRKRPVKKV